MTQEKASILIQTLSQEPEKAQRLYAMEPEQAAAELCAMGCDVTAEDLKDFGKALEQYQKTSGGELSEEQMEDVAGGGSMAAVVAVMIAMTMNNSSWRPIMPSRGPWWR